MLAGLLLIPAAAVLVLGLALIAALTAALSGTGGTES